MEKSSTTKKKKWGRGWGFAIHCKQRLYTQELYLQDTIKMDQKFLIDRGKNKEPRKLTPRDVLIKDFKNFIISESSNQAYKQFGNSLPIPVVKSIIKEMLK